MSYIPVKHVKSGLYRGKNTYWPVTMNHRRAVELKTSDSHLTATEAVHDLAQRRAASSVLAQRPEHAARWLFRALRYKLLQIRFGKTVSVIHLEQTRVNQQIYVVVHCHLTVAGPQIARQLFRSSVSKRPVRAKLLHQEDLRASRYLDSILDLFLCLLISVIESWPSH